MGEGLFWSLCEYTPPRGLHTRGVRRPPIESCTNCKGRVKGCDACGLWSVSNPPQFRTFRGSAARSERWQRGSPGLGCRWTQMCQPISVQPLLSTPSHRGLHQLQGGSDAQTLLPRPVLCGTKGRTCKRGTIDMARTLLPPLLLWRFTFFLF